MPRKPLNQVLKLHKMPQVSTSQNASTNKKNTLAPSNPIIEIIQIPICDQANHFFFLIIINNYTDNKTHNLEKTTKPR